MKIRRYNIAIMGAEVGLCTSSWERLGNLHSRANAETQRGRTRRAGEEQGGRKVAGKSSRRICDPAEAQKLEGIDKAWDAVPAWVGQARFSSNSNLRITYEPHATRSRPARSTNLLKLSLAATNIKETSTQL